MGVGRDCIKARVSDGIDQFACRASDCAGGQFDEAASDPGALGYGLGRWLGF